MLHGGRVWHRVNKCNNIYNASDIIYTQTWGFYDHEYDYNRTNNMMFLLYLNICIVAIYHICSLWCLMKIYGFIICNLSSWFMHFPMDFTTFLTASYTSIKNAKRTHLCLNRVIPIRQNLRKCSWWGRGWVVWTRSVLCLGISITIGSPVLPISLSRPSMYVCIQHIWCFLIIRIDWLG